MLHPSTIEEYCESYSAGFPELLKMLHRETHIKAANPKNVSPLIQGYFLFSIVRMLKPTSILEIGTFSGFSTIAMGMAMNNSGIIDTVDNDTGLEGLRDKYIKLAGLENIIETHVSDGLKFIQDLDKKYDLIFIDANKLSYSSYYDRCLHLIEPGGFIIIDNVLWKNKVLDSKHDKLTKAIHQLNEQISKDNRVINMILNHSDGMQIIERIE